MKSRACQGAEPCPVGCTAITVAGASRAFSHRGATARSSAAGRCCMAHEPSTACGAPGMLWGSGLDRRTAMIRDALLGLRTKQIRARLSSRPYTPTNWGTFPPRRVTPTASPAGILGMMSAQPGRPWEQTCSLDGTDAAGHHCAHSLPVPKAEGGENRQGDRIPRRPASRDFKGRRGDCRERWFR